MATPPDDATSEPGSKTPKRRLTLIRSFSLADLITLCNGAAGMGAVLLSMAYVGSGERPLMWGALGLLPLALVFDVADGAVARWRRRSSPFGADLDSLADVVSFGVAPAAIAFALGMRGMLDGFVLIYFVGCGISRLARFNVTAEALMTDKGKVSHFEGTPIPTSVLLVLVLAVAFATDAVGDRLWLGELDLGMVSVHPLVLMFLASGTAMVSATLKIPKP
ncbi:MAG: CDP-alcohol phosphatidyltransferase family protein [Sandaracinaceae bacterium]|nr:CDP-alcohol phosphatidyltransferase family protein [Sandaracinaceae bacterium]